MYEQKPMYNNPQQVVATNPVNPSAVGAAPPMPVGGVPMASPVVGTPNVMSGVPQPNYLNRVGTNRGELGMPWEQQFGG